MEIGAQMYTVRAFCQTPEGIAQSLERIAQIGYRTVQVSGTCDYDAAWLRRELDSRGLRCVITHTPANRLREETERVIRDHDSLGCRYVGLGYWAFDEARGMGWDDFMAAWPPVARALRAGGKYFMYHNHDREFIRRDGEPILLRLAESVPAEEMGFTLDTYWVQFAGGDPAAWIDRLRGRVPCVHLKDYAWGHRMAALGEGNLNLDRILKSAEAAGTEYLLVEQDDCGGDDPFDCLRRSYAYLKARGLG